MRNTVLKQLLNKRYGKNAMIKLRCDRCSKPFGGKIYQISIPTTPICYGSDENPNIDLMHPHLYWHTFSVCEDCCNKLLEFMGGQNETEIH